MEREESDEKWKLTTWGMLTSLDQVLRNAGEETKDYITLIWNQSLIDNPFGDGGELDDD